MVYVYFCFAAHTCLCLDWIVLQGARRRDGDDVTGYLLCRQLGHDMTALGEGGLRARAQHTCGVSSVLLHPYICNVASNVQSRVTSHHGTRGSASCDASCGGHGTACSLLHRSWGANEDTWLVGMECARSSEGKPHHGWGGVSRGSSASHDAIARMADI